MYVCQKVCFHSHLQGLPNIPTLAAALKNCDTRELPKLSGWSVHGQDRDSIIFQMIFSTLTILFISVYVLLGLGFFLGKISVRSVLDLEVRVLDI